MSSAAIGNELALESGRAATTAGDYERARLAYAEALRSDPNSVPAQIGLAEVTLAQGRPAEAEGMFARLQTVELQPRERVRVLEGQGLALMQLQRPDEARAKLLEATAVEPNAARAWNGLGQLHDAREEWADAQQAYARALAIRPNWPAALNNLGLSYLRSGDARRAEQSFARALQLDPTLAVVDMNLRLALAAQGRYAEAVADVEPDQRGDVLNNVGYVALLRGDDEQADAFLSEALLLGADSQRTARQNLEFLKSQHPAAGAVVRP